MQRKLSPSDQAILSAAPPTGGVYDGGRWRSWEDFTVAAAAAGFVESPGTIASGFSDPACGAPIRPTAPPTRPEPRAENGLGVRGPTPREKTAIQLEWDTAIRARLAKTGGNVQKAIQLIAEEQPELRRKLIQEANKNRRGR